MATLTVTATALGSYSAKVTGMTAVGGDNYHVLHGLGATPHEFIVTARSHPAVSVPMYLILGSYDATVAWFNSPVGPGGSDYQVDVVIRRTHSLAI